MKNLKYIITLLLLLFSVNIAQSQRIKFTLQWTAQSQFVGYYVAQELGLGRKDVVLLCSCSES